MTSKVRRPSSEPPITDIASTKDNINMGVYCYPGKGKTVWATSHPNSLILAADNGTVSAGRYGSQAKMWRIHDWPEFEKAQKWIRAGGYKRFEWIVIDSITMLREKCMRHTLELEHARSAARDEFIPAQPDHQKVQNVIKRVVETFCDLPVNFLMTAHAMHIESRSGEEVVLPMIHGQNGDTAQYCVGLLDSLGYMEVVEDEGDGEVRRIHWQPYEEFLGKDRFDVLKPYTDDVLLPEIQRRIEAPITIRSAGSKRRTATTARRRRTTTRRTA